MKQKQIENNAHRILRFLYHHRDSWKSRKQIQGGTSLTKKQVEYALDYIHPQYIDRRERETAGGISNAYVYNINNDGRTYVRDEIDEVPVSQNNQEEIERLETELIELRSELETWKDFVSRWVESAENRFDDLEDHTGIDYYDYVD